MPNSSQFLVDVMPLLDVMQYDYKQSAGGLESGDGRAVFLPSKDTTAQDLFLVENAARMLRILGAVDNVVPGEPIHPVLVVAVQRFMSAAIDAGIDVIAINESSVGDDRPALSPELAAWFENREAQAQAEQDKLFSSRVLGI